MVAGSMSFGVAQKPVLGVMPVSVAKPDAAVWQLPVGAAGHCPVPSTGWITRASAACGACVGSHPTQVKNMCSEVGMLSECCVIMVT